MSWEDDEISQQVLFQLAACTNRRGFFAALDMVDNGFRGEDLRPWNRDIQEAIIILLENAGKENALGTLEYVNKFLESIAGGITFDRGDTFDDLDPAHASTVKSLLKFIPKLLGVGEGLIDRAAERDIFFTQNLVLLLADRLEVVIPFEDKFKKDVANFKEIFSRLEDQQRANTMTLAAFKKAVARAVCV